MGGFPQELGQTSRNYRHHNMLFHYLYKADFLKVNNLHIRGSNATETLAGLQGPLHATSKVADSNGRHKGT